MHLSRMSDVRDCGVQQRRSFFFSKKKRYGPVWSCSVGLLEERLCSFGHSFFLIGEKSAQAQVPGSVVGHCPNGRRFTALSKPGGVRGIVAGDVIRRLVARTISQQLAPSVERATSHTNMRRGLVVSVWLTPSEVSQNWTHTSHHHFN